MPKNQAPNYETPALREIEDLIRGRRTISLYLETPVPRALVENAIDLATWAPNHHVTEPWRFYLLGPETVGRCLDLCGDIVRATKGDKAARLKRESWAEKPGWLVVTCQRSDDDLRQQEDYAACSAALQNLALYLWQAGVGTKWTTGAITRDPRFADIIGFDPDETFVVGLVWYGYPRVTPTQVRKPLGEVLTELP